MTDPSAIDHTRKVTRERVARWRAANPNRNAANRHRLLRAERVLRDRHRDEYLTLMRTEKYERDAVSWRYAGNRAVAILKRRYDLEWWEIMRGTK